MLFYIITIFSSFLPTTNEENLATVLSGNLLALVVLICLCTLLFSVTNFLFVIVICHVFVMFFLEIR